MYLTYTIHQAQCPMHFPSTHQSRNRIPIKTPNLKILGRSMEGISVLPLGVVYLSGWLWRCEWEKGGLMFDTLERLVEEH